MIKLPYRVDITHLQKKTGTGSYGLPGDEEFFHPEAPDKKDVPCYYYQLSDNISVSQGEPDQQVRITYKMIFSYFEDVRLNDLVIINESEFWLALPEKKLHSHIEVIALKVIR